MDHVAIMKKSWGLTDKILTRKKTIESRWYRSKRRPWDGIKAGETVYFKDSGGPVRAKARVEKVLQFAGLTPKSVASLLGRYAAADGISRAEKPAFYRKFKDKKFCILIFLGSTRTVRPFEIDKKGFGAMAAWLSVPGISQIRKHT